MIQIDGTDYAEPTDKAIVAYSGGDYVLVTIGDACRRVSITEFATGAHNHDNEWIRPLGVGRADGATALWLHGYAGNYCQLFDNGNIQWSLSTGKRFDVLGASRIRADSAFTYALELTGPAAYRYALAEGWHTYACSESFKTDIEPIGDSLSKTSQATGITYKQDGIDGTGITAEDLEAMGCPGLVKKDEKGEYIGVNLTGVVPILLNAINDLTERVRSLEEGIKQ